MMGQQIKVKMLNSGRNCSDEYIRIKKTAFMEVIEVVNELLDRYSKEVDIGVPNVAEIIVVDDIVTYVEISM